MDITEIQTKVGHSSKNQHEDKCVFQMAEGIFVQSALILRKHGKSDDEITAMLRTDFKLNDEQIKNVMKDLDTKGGEISQ